MMPFVPNIVGTEIAYAHNGLLHGIYAMQDFDQGFETRTGPYGPTGKTSNCSVLRSI